MRTSDHQNGNAYMKNVRCCNVWMPSLASKQRQDVPDPERDQSDTTTSVSQPAAKAATWGVTPRG